WVALTEAQQQVSLAERNLQTYHTTASEVRARYERGIRSPLDVRLALANEASARAALADRRTALERARRQLDILRGLHPRGGSSPAAALPEAPGEVPAGLPSELLTRRPDVAQAERRLAAAQSRTKQARAARFPRLALTGSGGTTTAELSDLLNQDFSVWSIGANVAAPILDGGRRRASVRQAEARAREAQALYGAAILNAFREVENGLAAEALQREREAQVVQAWDHARAAAVLAEDRYRSGLEDIITLLESQRRSAEAESLALAVRRQRLENRIHLHLALGGGFNRKSEAASLIHKQEQTP
ncbi:MAG TPA: TolC family protein, partial [Methylomirabilota bacterium]|nr:TolC family protein [Methylomirabilota bacterium]